MPFVVYRFLHALAKLALPCYVQVKRLNFLNYLGTIEGGPLPVLAKFFSSTKQD